MPLVPVFIAGVLLWALGSGAWATAGVVLTFLTSGIALVAFIIVAGVAFFTHKALTKP